MADTDAKHARKRAAPAAAARNRAAREAARKPRKPKAAPVRYVGGRPMDAPPTAEGRKQVKPGQVTTSVTERSGRYSAKHMLTAELLVGVGIVAIRAIADYEPQADGTLKGKVGHPKGQYGPLPILAGLIVSFFLLSFLAASGGTKAKLAVIAGGILDLGLLLNSSDQFVKVSATFGTFGKAKVPPGSWVTTGPAFGAPIQDSGTSSGGLVPGRGGGVAPSNPPGIIPIPASGVCPAGYHKAGGKCWPIVQGGPPAT